MHMADRIQKLRKEKGISQEELAQNLGVSRQAVSKGESGQSLPDLDKVIGMSDFLGVSTDYLLKGTEPSETGKKEAGAGVFVAAATALDAIGLILSAAVWYETQHTAALAAGLVFLVLGCMVFGIGLTGLPASAKEAAKRKFFSINIWLLSFIPLSLLYNILLSGTPAPYPLPASPLLSYPAFWLVYIALGLGVDLAIQKKRRDS